MKLSEMIEKINPDIAHLYGHVDDPYEQSFCIAKEFWDESKKYAKPDYQFVESESYRNLRSVAIELAKACEGMIGGSVCHSSETTCGIAINRAKEILEGK